MSLSFVWHGVVTIIEYHYSRPMQALRMPAGLCLPDRAAFIM
jgi:hypothetical protein